MASATAKARRRALAEGRLEAATASLSARLGIDQPAEGRPVRDPQLAATIDLERQADLLEAADAKLAADLADADAGLDGIVAAYEARIVALGAELAAAREAAEATARPKARPARGKAKA